MRWGLELVGRYYMWFDCRDANGRNVHSHIYLEQALIATDKAIVVETKKKHSDFSTMCTNCHIRSSLFSKATIYCDCWTNGWQPPLSLDLTTRIMGMPNGLPCFRDSSVCATEVNGTTVPQPHKPMRDRVAE